MEQLEDKSRTLWLTEKGWGTVLDGDTPLLGGIVAGRGLEAVVAGEQAYSLAAELLLPGSGKRRYLLRVVDQSMMGSKTVTCWSWRRTRIRPMARWSLRY